MYFSIVFAFAGDSTITRFFATCLLGLADRRGDLPDLPPRRAPQRALGLRENGVRGPLIPLVGSLCQPTPGGLRPFPRPLTRTFGPWNPATIGARGCHPRPDHPLHGRRG